MNEHPEPEILLWINHPSAGMSFRRKCATKDYTKPLCRFRKNLNMGRSDLTVVRHDCGRRLFDPPFATIQARPLDDLASIGNKSVAVATCRRRYCDATLVPPNKASAPKLNECGIKLASRIVSIGWPVRWRR